MDTKDDLLDAVVREPDSDQPRRRYAAHLRGLGDPRGEFIDAQLDLAGSRKGDAKLEARSRALLADHRAAWSAPVAAWTRDVMFVRGFIELVTMPATSFIEHGPKLLRAAPIRHVMLDDAGPSMAALVMVPQLDAVRSLGLFSGRLTDADVGLLAGSPYVSRLRWLDLGYNRITDAGVAALAASRSLGALAYVNLVGNPCANPVEEYGRDYDGSIVGGSVELPDAGAALEARHGRVAWLHAPSVFATYPPSPLER